jgi:hypothetical protein
VQQSFGCEIGESFAEGLSVDVESAGEFALAGQFPGEFTGGDGLANFLAQALEFVAHADLPAALLWRTDAFHDESSRRKTNAACCAVTHLINHC